MCGVKYLSFYLKKQKEKKEQDIKTKVTGREKIRKIRAEINTVEEGQF